MSETAPEGTTDAGTGTDASASTGTASQTNTGTAGSTSTSTAGTAATSNVDASGVPYGPSSNWSAHDTGEVDSQGAKIYADTGKVVNITGDAITIQSDIDGETYVFAQTGLDMNNTSVGESATIFYYDNGTIIEVQ